MHTERDKTYYEKFDDYSLWFNGAADHLFELQIPKNHPDKIEIEQWQERCLFLRLNHATKKDFHEAIDKAKSFLIKTDDSFIKIETEKAEYE